MGDLFKLVGSVTPSVLSGWAAQYVGLFKQTVIFPPDPSARTTNTTVAIGTVLAIVATSICRFWPKKRLVVFALGLLILSLLMIAVGFWANYRIDHPITREFSDILFSVWNVTGPIAVVSCMLTVLFATLYTMRATGATGAPPSQSR
jgi:hypothetical protein